MISAVSVPRASAAYFEGASQILLFHSMSQQYPTSIGTYVASMDIPNTGWMFPDPQDANTWNRYIINNLKDWSYNRSPVIGATGMYISYYMQVQPSTGSLVAYGSPLAKSTYQAYYVNDQTATVTMAIDSLATFTPVGITQNSPGITLTAKFQGSEEYPITKIGIQCKANASGFPLGAYYPANNNMKGVITVTSARIVGTETSGELGALEDIASEIANQSEILSAMYGDLVAVCNSIYQRCGDLLTAQNLTNQYFAQLIPILQNIESDTSGILTTTNNIYNLLSAQFSLLVSTIRTESDDIQAAIAQQTEDMKAYFDSVFASAVDPDLTQDAEDLQGTIDDFGSIESDYQSQATDRYEALTSTFNGFTGGTLSGVALMSTLFERVWNALGDYNIVYTFPLTLGVTLVVVGRISRTHSRSSSKADSGGKPPDSGGDGK